MLPRRSGHRYRPSGWTLNAIVFSALVCGSFGLISVRGGGAHVHPRSTTTSTPTTTTVKRDACGALVPKPGGGYWSCTLNAGFTGTTLDPNVWIPETTAQNSFHNGPECLVNSPNNISVANGVLTLTARKEATPFVCNDPEGNFATQYTGAEISTRGLFSQAYGMFEVRAKLPSTSIPGLQESFWMWPDNATLYGPTWPESGEIDMAEFYSDYADRAIPFIHYNNPYDANATNDSCLISNIGDWNTYGVVWTPTSITIVYNGHTCLVDNWDPAAPQVKPEPFNQPFFIVLSQVLGIAPNAFNPTTTPLPASTQVKWVKAWK